MRSRPGAPEAPARVGPSAGGLPAAASPSQGSPALEIRIRRQPAFEQPEPWLEEIREFRGRILYEDGRRPRFRTSDGRYVDSQPLDMGSFHLTAHLGPGEEIASYVRLSPPEVFHEFQVHRYLGTERYEAMVAERGVDKASVFEMGRLATSPHARGRKLAATMVAASMAACRTMGAVHIVAFSGMADGQHLLFSRLGWDVQAGTETYAPDYEDTVCVIAHRVDEGAREYEAVTADTQRRIDKAVQAYYWSHTNQLRLTAGGVPAR